MQRRIHSSDHQRRLVFKDLKNGMTIQELHDKYGINKKTLQSMKEERQDVGKPIQIYLIRKILSRIPVEQNLKKLLKICKKKVREMITNPDQEFKKLLNDYNSRRKIKLVKTNRKIIDKISDLIVKIATGEYQYSPWDSIKNPSDDSDSSVSAHYHFKDNENYPQDEECNHIAQIQQIDKEENNIFINQALFEDSQYYSSTQWLSNSQDSYNQIDDVQRNIQPFEDHQESEETTISSETFRE